MPSWRESSGRATTTTREPRAHFHRRGDRFRGLLLRRPHLDLLLDDAECRGLIEDAGFGEALEATNAELNPKGLYLTHIFGPEQEILAPGWRERCRPVELPGLRKLTVSVLGAVDLALTKLGRGDEGDFDDIRFLLDTRKLDPGALRSAVDEAQVPEILSDAFLASREKLFALIG